MRNTRYKWIPIFICIWMTGCHKGFLDKKPDNALVVPQTLTDMEALLDNSNAVMNLTPWMGTVASDEVYVDEQDFRSLSARDQNCYIWADDIYLNEIPADWSVLYQQVFYANVVLDGIERIHLSEGIQQAVNEIKGRALFVRAHAYFNLMVQFGGLDPGSPESTWLGIPLALVADVAVQLPRASIQTSFDQIVSDLQEAATLLSTTSSVKTRPTRSAARALLARVYLYVGNFNSALQEAEACLVQYDQLIDYNQLDTAIANPFEPSLPSGNPEVIYHSRMITNSLTGNNNFFNVDSALLDAYDAADLRTEAYFHPNAAGKLRFSGGYTGTYALFTGLAVDELYLIAAECYVRLGNTEAAEVLLNKLLQNRYNRNSWRPISFLGPEECLTRILLERRKELLFRGIRWMDLRRLNLEGRQTTLIRNLGNQEQSLLPNDPKYLFPLPDLEIAVGNIQQNPR